MASPSFTARESASRSSLTVANVRLVTLAIAAAVAAMWLLLHLYLGIWDDAVLYAMQGLAHLHPHLYGHDLFLRYGSQDRYTIFGSLYAPLIGWLGIDHAAEWVTLLSQCAFFWMAWRLARRVMPAPLAALAVGLLVVLPDYYGASRIFQVVENFATPRLGAEALVLGAVLASINGRTLSAALLCVAAAALHPVMAAAGVAFLLWRHLALHRPKLTVALACAGIAGVLIIGWLPSTASLRFDPVWFRLDWLTAPYLLLTKWSVTDWTGVLLTFATLAVGVISLDRERIARSLALTALVIGAAGLALTALGGDWLHIIVIVQGQPWRWLWLSRAVATLLLPLIGVQLWRRGPLSRAALLLLLAAYPEQSQAGLSVFVLAPLAVLAASLRPSGSSALARYSRYAVVAAGGALLIYTVSFVADTWVAAVLPRFYDIDNPTIDRLRHLTQSGMLPAALLVLAACLAVRWPFRRTLVPLIAAGMAAILALMPVAARQWTRVIFTPAVIHAFAPWRARIPVGTEVLFVTHRQLDPLACWVLLRRPSYFSIQAWSGLFSRRAAMAEHRRLDQLAPLFYAYGRQLGNLPFAPASARQQRFRNRVTLGSLCATAPVRFIATTAPLEGRPVAVMDRTSAGPFRGLKLYQCGPP